MPLGGQELWELWSADRQPEFWAPEMLRQADLRKGSTIGALMKTVGFCGPLGILPVSRVWPD